MVVSFGKGNCFQVACWGCEPGEPENGYCGGVQAKKGVQETSGSTVVDSFGLRGYSATVPK